MLINISRLSSRILRVQLSVKTRLFFTKVFARPRKFSWRLDPHSPVMNDKSSVSFFGHKLGSYSDFAGEKMAVSFFISFFFKGHISFLLLGLSYLEDNLLSLRILAVGGFNRLSLSTFCWLWSRNISLNCIPVLQVIS